MATQVNWAIVAACIFTLFVGAWGTLVWRYRPGWLRAISSLGFVATAGSMCAAPFRASVDDHYPGFSFGFIHSAGGVPVVLISASVIVTCLIAAYLLICSRRSASLVFISAMSVALLVNVGVPLVQGMFGDLSSNEIQFGQYLKIPGATATPILVVLELLPFALALIWSLRALRSAA